MTDVKKTVAKALSATVPLSLAVPVPDEDGKATLVESLVVKRPRTRHIKNLALIIGADVVKILIGETKADGGFKLDDVDMAKLAGDLIEKLFDENRLNALEAWVADLCAVPADSIGDTDPEDFVKVVVAIAGFFFRPTSQASSEAASS